MMMIAKLYLEAAHVYWETNVNYITYTKQDRLLTLLLSRDNSGIKIRTYFV